MHALAVAHWQRQRQVYAAPSLGRMGSGACCMAGIGDSDAAMPLPPGRRTSLSAPAAAAPPLGTGPPLSADASCAACCPD